ncbi:hypothetical protein [Liquorilactobacillus vini]|uniref:Lipoprotein n=1 Tax=Liquorilactobacillus vini DSM 20605 TaxID=1133569 RepID=A0A0R2CDH7_9LACO|nr:hypothetical protein [Liquorilactobacillus vini]KRM89328.1 lipoprotein [Liquorilactobacillus vini DSM 20605]
MKKQLFFVVALLLLSGCGGQSKQAVSATSKVNSSQTSAAKKSSVTNSVEKSSAVTSSASATTTSSSVSSQSSNQNQTYPRIILMNQQLVKALGQVVLPQVDGLDAGSQRLNVRYRGNAANFTIDYSVGSTAKDFNDSSLNQENPYAVYSKQTFENSTQAAQQINYRSADEFSGLPQTNLGYGITGTIDAGAGQRYLSWYEGNWYLTVHAAAVNQEDPTPLAKQTVAFLASNSLPAPQKYGRISFQTAITNRQRDQEIIWQKNNVVYRLQTHTPQTALKMAVSIK